MKRSWMHVGGAVLVVVAIAAVVGVAVNSNKHTDNSTVLSQSTTKQTSISKPKQACLIFTIDDAKQVLGEGASGGETGASASSDDLEVSTCSYTQTAGAATSASTSKAASLLVRAPRTAEGVASNQTQFGRLKPAEVQDVTGYGEAAFWSQQYGQLNIFKSNTWYIVSFGPITPSSRTLDQTKQLADILINKM
ncbi:hypothetical protein KW803_02755 [Candidatus Saccharibacteria bacterium]|nr:hypothetical protein [Candidatus Saccharibacteria bacterium]